MKPKRIFTRNVFGKPVELGGAGGGVEKVASLPEKGEEGKIYYNTSDGIYYVYDKENFTAIGSVIETVATFQYISEIDGLPSVDTQIPIPEDEHDALPALYYYYNSDDVMKLWIVRQQDENYVIVHPLDVNPNTIFYNSTHHYYFKIAPVPYVDSFNDNIWEAIGYKYKPIVVCTEQTIIPPKECTWSLELKKVGFGILSPSCFCDMGYVDSVNFTQIGSIPYNKEPLLRAQVISGRFRANLNNISIILLDGISPADGNPSIEVDHWYEYSIFDGILNLIDVTPDL